MCTIFKQKMFEKACHVEPLVHVQPAGCFIFLQIMTFEQVSPASISYSRCLNEEHACNMHNNKLCVVGVTAYNRTLERVHSLRWNALY